MKKTICLFIAAVMLIFSLCGCAPKPKFEPDDPVTLTMWHVYGSQTKSPLNDTIDEFNNTVGKEKGIVVNVVSVSSSSAIDEALTAAAKGTPGVPPLPDLFTAYPRVAEIIGHDKLLDWNDYFTKKELGEFVDEFLDEGYFEDKLLMLPIAKSTELLFVNKTLFDRFALDANVTLESLSSYEGLFLACEKFYDYSGGHDMFQINDFYHYFLTGMASMGEELIKDGKLNVESDAFKAVWKPMAHSAIYGGLCLGDGYASDRWKTGEVIANVGSTAGILYLRDYVTYEDNTTEDIEISTLAYPRFENGDAVVVHRGGLFAVKNEDERKNEAAAYFAKWLNEKENSIGFVAKAGYLPVTDEAFSYLFENTGSVENERYRMLYDAVNGMSNEYTYIKIPVFDGAADTQASFEKNIKLVLNIAHEEYLDRVKNGENGDAVLNELVDSALLEFCGMYE